MTKQNVNPMYPFSIASEKSHMGNDVQKNALVAPSERGPELRDRYFEGDALRVTLSLAHNSVIDSGFVADLSLSGAGIFFPAPHDTPLKALTLGEAISVTFHLGAQNSVPQSARVLYLINSKHSGKIGSRIGLIFEKPNASIATTLVRSENRRSERFNIPPFFRPKVICEDMFKFAEYIYFEIANFSSTGMGLITSARNRSIQVGFKIELQVNLLGQKPINCPVQVMSKMASSQDDGRIYIGVTFLHKSTTLLNALVNILMLSGAEKSISTLKQNQLPANELMFGFHFSYVQNQSELYALLKLRLKVQHQLGQFLDTNDPWKMVDSHDQNSRQIIARVGSKIVGAARIVFNNGDLTRSEHAQLGVNMPDWLIKDGFVEASRLLIDPDYRGSKLFLLLMQHLGKCTFESGHRYMLSSCTEGLEKIYLRSGCKRLDKFYMGTPPTLWKVVVLDLENSLRARKINPLSWFFVHRDVTLFFLKKRKIRENKSIKLKLNIVQLVIFFLIKAAKLFRR